MILGLSVQSKKKKESHKFSFTYSEMLKILKENYDISNDDLFVLCEMMINKGMFEYIKKKKKKKKSLLKLVKSLKTKKKKKKKKLLKEI